MNRIVRTDVWFSEDWWCEQYNVNFTVKATTQHAERIRLMLDRSKHELVNHEQAGVLAKHMNSDFLYTELYEDLEKLFPSKTIRIPDFTDKSFTVNFVGIGYLAFNWK